MMDVPYVSHGLDWGPVALVLLVFYSVLGLGAVLLSRPRKKKT